METVLRESEQQSLLAVTTTIAGSLKGRQELLFRDDSLPAVSSQQRARHHAGGALGRAAHRRARRRMGHRFAQPDPRRRARRRRRCGCWPPRTSAGCTSRCWCATTSWSSTPRCCAPLDSDSIGDRIWLAFDDKRGGQQQLFFGSTGAGHAASRAASKPANTAARKRSRNRASNAVWQRSRDGYVLEIGIPLSMVGQHIGVLIDDRDRRGAARSSYGTLEVVGPARHGPADRRLAGSQRPPAPVRAARRRAHGRLVDRRDPHAPRRARAARRLHAHARFPAAHVPPVPRRRRDTRAAFRRRNAQRAAEELTARVARGKPETALFAGRYENSVIVAAAAPIFSADGKHDLRRHPAGADRRSLAHAARPRAHAPAESHAVRHAVRRGRGVLVRGPHDPAHLAARRGQRDGAGPRGQPVARPARVRGHATSSATCRAASRRCSAGSTSTPATCARSPASWRTRSARR